MGFPIDNVHLWADWLSTHAKQLIRKRGQLAKSNAHKKDNGPELRRLSRETDKSGKEDTKRHTETAAAETEACLEDQDLQGGWFKLNLWMKQRGDKAFGPSFEDMTKLTDEMEDLHRRIEPQEEPIPTPIAPCQTADSAPAEDEITLAVKRLKSGKSPGASEMTAAHLKKWHRQAHPLTEEDIPQPEAWNKLVEQVQHAWEHSELPQELCCCVQVMVPNPDGGSRGIGLLEAVSKVLECIINSRVTAKVKFHDCLHGFRVARGTDTTQMESKLFQQLAGMDQETLFKACLDWAKAFATFNEERAFKKLHECGFPAKMLALIALQWCKMQVTPKQADFFSMPFCQDSGQITGSVLGPLVFNVVVDSVVRHWMTVMVNDGGTSAITGLAVKERLLPFCADDGMVASRDPAWLQEALTALVALF